MSDMTPASDRDIERVSASWLASQAADEAPDDWVEQWQTKRCVDGDYMAMWRFVLRLCVDVSDDDSETIEMIGVDPLNGMIITWPDTALTLIEAEVVTNSTLLEALSIVLTDSPIVRDRIDAILARHGKERL